MLTASRIRDHIDLLGDDEIFTTRDLLYCGKRNAIDLALSKMVKKNLIVRLARGVFVKQVLDFAKVNLVAVAYAKAKAFGKEICQYGRYAALKVGLIKESLRSNVNAANCKRRLHQEKIATVTGANGNGTDTGSSSGKEEEFFLYTSGCTSSFKFGETTIRFIAACKRKMHLPANKPGELLMAVWFCGRQKARALQQKARHFTGCFELQEKYQFRKLVRFMPFWIVQMFMP